MESDRTPGWYTGELPFNLTHLGGADALARHLIRSGHVTTTSVYEDPLALGAGLQAHLVRTVHTVRLDAANSSLARGWRIIATNYQGSVDESGLLVGREAMLVLGHPEPDAL